MAQSKARLDELKINLANTIIASPVDGFIGKRTLDPGASVGVNTSFISVVDIRTVRLVINVVEKDLRRITQGTAVDDRSRRVSRRELQRPRRARRADSRSGHTHGAGRNRDSQPRLPAEARHVRARAVHRRAASQRARRAHAGDRRRAGQARRLGARRAKRRCSIRSRSASRSRISPRCVSGLKEGQRIISTGAAALRAGDRSRWRASAVVAAGGAAGARRAHAGRLATSVHSKSRRRQPGQWHRSQFGSCPGASASDRPCVERR